MDWLEERKTPGGFLIQVTKNYFYQIETKRGLEIPKNSKTNSPLLPIPKIIFLGENFKLDHIRIGDITFVNSKNGKTMVPYQNQDGVEIKFLTYSSNSDSDILPVMIYQFKSFKDLILANEAGYTFHHVVIEETFPKHEMINLKIRYPSLNILIIKKKVS